MKTFPYLAAGVVFSLLVWCPSADAKPKERYDPGTKTTRYLEFKYLRAGYKVFRYSCKKCHTRQNPDAPFLHTESRTMNGWNRVFEKRTVQCAKKGYWDELTAEELLVVNDYLYYYAYDSYDPEDYYGYGGGIFFHF